jgi:hypothetical protein
MINREDIAVNDKLATEFGTEIVMITMSSFYKRNIK